MSDLQRHRMTFTLLKPAVSLFMKWKFNYQYDDLSKIEGPYLLLVNHNLELDPLAVGVAVGRQLYFVASEHIMRKGIGTWLLMRYFRPIIHMKGRQGMQTVKEMLKTMKEGNSVCIFPEGNRSFNGLTGDMLPTIGKVARCSGVKLVTYRIEGGYLTQPRWSLTIRKGRLQGRLIREYTKEELKAMTNEQVNQAIREDLYEDAYATQRREKIAFRGKNLALGLETTVFTCPKCGQIGTLHSEGDRFYCDCGFQAVYDVYGQLTDEEGKTYTITELDHMQQRALEERVAASSQEKPLFSDEITWYEIDSRHTVTQTETGTLTAYKDRLECCGRVLYYQAIRGIAIYSRNSLILHVEGMDGHVEIKSGSMFCALKYLYLFNAKEKVS